MSSGENKAIAALVQTFGTELKFGQTLIRKTGAAFEIRHFQDDAVAAEKLLRLTRGELRHWTQQAEDDTYRPLKSSPTLAPGWIYQCADLEGLDDALQIIYPGSVADWHATFCGDPPVTGYREFTDRQTGMYRITQLLSDDQASAVTTAVCDPKFCIKRRLWSIQGLEIDPPETKSSIPCLEPCALLLEFARKAMRIEQEEKMSIQLAPSERESMIAALESAICNPSPQSREGDAGDPASRRRLQLLLIKLKTSV